MNKIPKKYLADPQLLAKDSAGRVLMEAKVAHLGSRARGNAKLMLSVYVFAGRRENIGYKSIVPRYIALRTVHDADMLCREGRRKTLRTMCDLAAMNLGGVEYALREAIK